MDFSFLKNRRVLDSSYVSDMIGKPIKSFNISAGAKKGDNVIGKMLAVEIEAEDDSKLHVIIKSGLPLQGELDMMTVMQSKFYSQLEIFPVEITYYGTIRPFLHERSGFPMLDPTYFSGVCDGINDYLCLEDLRSNGFKMADKYKGLEFGEMNKALEKLAILHAHSYAAIKAAERGECEVFQELMKKRNGVGFHIWLRPMDDLDQEIFFNAIIEKMGEILKEDGDLENAGKLERFKKIGYKIMIDLWKKTGVSEGGKPDKYFKVLLHGDLWTNNILFKYNSAGDLVEDAAFIDFQQCRFGNIFEDLLYLFFTSSTVDFRRQNLRSCLTFYAQEFLKQLKQIPGEEEVPPPSGYSEEEVISTFYENIEYGFVYNLVGIPFQLGIQKDAPPSASASETGMMPPKDATPSPPPTLSGLEMALMHAEMLKHSTKNSPVAVQRLKEMVNEMIKLNILV